jgi:hypothetical protein
VQKRLRFTDLKTLGIVNNRVTLSNWIRGGNFPPGQLTGPNTRTWGEDEVQDYLDHRPSGPKCTPRACRIGPPQQVGAA